MRKRQQLQTSTPTSFTFHNIYNYIYMSGDNLGIVSGVFRDYKTIHVVLKKPSTNVQIQNRENQLFAVIGTSVVIEEAPKNCNKLCFVFLILCFLNFLLQFFGASLNGTCVISSSRLRSDGGPCVRPSQFFDYESNNWK